jgi:UDP-N-acetylglucosamine 2-epimerase (non-hydrolysing)
MKKTTKTAREIHFDRKILPVKLNDSVLEKVFNSSSGDKRPILSIVIGTKPDFYKQAPLILEASRSEIPMFVINTGQHFDKLLGYGISEFEIQDHIGCNLQIRGDLMEKASELIVKFGTFGRYCKKKYGNDIRVLPIVHGDTIVAGIAPLAWVFGVGQKVAQNEAGLRSMSPTEMKNVTRLKEPSRSVIEKFVASQLYGNWFIARDEPFPEQIDTWICSAGTQYFFAPTSLNKDNLIREGYPAEYVHTVGNSVVDAINMKRQQKTSRRIFDLFPALESDDWLRVDIHRRENLTRRRFTSILHSIGELVRQGRQRIIFIMLNATGAAIKSLNLDGYLQKLADNYPKRFIISPLWKEYAHVIEFLDSGHCWAEMTDSGSMQEELLYFDNVMSLTVRLNTDRPETVFDARSNVLIPPVSKELISAFVTQAYERREGLGIKLGNKKHLYGEPGRVSKRIIRILKTEFEKGDVNFFPWLHQRINLWKENSGPDYW